MDPLALGGATIARILQAAGERLHGEWLLVGGAAAAVWFAPQRVTEDIDLVAFVASNAEQLAVMQLAADHGLPVEAINLAAAYFVAQVDGWQREVEVLVRGTNATVYRPTPTLFLLLKVRRLSEQDLDDCVALLAFADAHALAVDAGRVLAAILALRPTPDAALAQRRARLHATIVARATTRGG